MSVKLEKKKKYSVLSFENYPHLHQTSVTTGKQWLSCLFVP